MSNATKVSNDFEIWLEDNSDLLWSLVHKYRKGNTCLDYEGEDLYHEAVYICLVAWDKYDPSRAGARSTFLTTCIGNHFNSITSRPSHIKTRKKLGIASYEEPSCNHEVSCLDSSLTRDPLEIVAELELVKNIRDSLSDIQQEIFKLRLNHRTQQEIATSLGRSQPFISYELRKMRSIVMGIINESW